MQIKQNLVAWLISFANKQGIDIKSALPLLNLLDMILSIQRNVYYLHTLKFTHLWHKGLLPDIFRDAFHYARMSNRSLFQKNQTLSTVRAIFAETKHYLILPKLTLF